MSDATAAFTDDSLRKGSGQDRLQADVEALGVDIDGDQADFPDDGALALAARATGVQPASARTSAMP